MVTPLLSQHHLKSENYPSRAGRSPSRAKHNPSRDRRSPSKAVPYPSRAGYYLSRSGRDPSRAGPYPSRAGHDPSRAGRYPLTSHQLSNNQHSINFDPICKPIRVNNNQPLPSKIPGTQRPTLGTKLKPRANR